MTDRFSTHSRDTAPDASRPLLAAAEQQFGFVPNVVGQIAESPAALSGTLQLMKALEQSSLSRGEQWIALLVASRAYAADYCVAANSTVAHMMGVPDDVIHAVRAGAPLGSPRYEALRTFTRAIVEHHGAAPPAAIRAFLDAGFTRAQVFEVLMAVSLETMASYTARAVVPVLDGAYQPFAWQGGAEAGR